MICSWSIECFLLSRETIFAKLFLNNKYYLRGLLMLVNIGVRAGGARGAAAPP